MRIQFFCTIPVIQCKAYETGLELCLISSVSWATFESLVGKSFLVRKIDKSSVYFFSPNQIRCQRTANGLGMHRWGWPTWHAFCCRLLWKSYNFLGGVPEGCFPVATTGVFTAVIHHMMETLALLSWDQYFIRVSVYVTWTKWWRWSSETHVM